MTMDPDERFAMVVIFGEIEGGRFDWTAGRWEKRTP